MKNINRTLLGIIPTVILGLVAINYYVLFPLRDQVIDKELVHMNARNLNIAQLTVGRLQTAELLLDNSANLAIYCELYVS
jgi:hypothetical protein